MKNEVGLVISLCRKHLNLKQDYLAHQLGITVHSYANIENGRVDINIKKLTAIAKLLGLKNYEILALAEGIRKNRKQGLETLAVGK